MKTWLKKLFCRHKWEDISGQPIPDNVDGDILICSRLHKCSKCETERMLGSGLMG